MFAKTIKIVLITVLVLFGLSGNAQKVKFKKGVVYVDGKECLKYETASASTEIYIYDLDGNEIIFYQRNRDGLYGTKIVFTEIDVELENDYAYGKSGLIKKLILNKVLSSDCALDEEKAKSFAKKFDQNTSRIRIKN